jgi:hypothetical protein
MSEERRIRVMTYDDIPAVAVIEKNLFPQPWSETVFSVQLQRESGIYLVFEIAGDIVGYLIADIFVDVWHIMDPVVVDISPVNCLSPTSASPSESRIVVTHSKCGSATKPPSIFIAVSASSAVACVPTTTRTTMRTL